MLCVEFFGMLSLINWNYRKVLCFPLDLCEKLLILIWLRGTKNERVEFYQRKPLRAKVGLFGIFFNFCGVLKSWVNSRIRRRSLPSLTPINFRISSDIEKRASRFTYNGNGCGVKWKISFSCTDQHSPLFLGNASALTSCFSKASIKWSSFKSLSTIPTLRFLSKSTGEAQTIFRDFCMKSWMCCLSSRLRWTKDLMTNRRETSRN